MEMIQKLLNSFVTELSVYLVQSPMFQGALKEAVKQALDERLEDGDLEHKIDVVAQSKIDDLDADGISGLDNAIENEVEKQLGSFEVDADNVSGLENAIEDKLGDWEVDASQIRDLDDAIIEHIAKSKELHAELQRHVLSGLVVKVDAQIDGKSIEGIQVEAH